MSGGGGLCERDVSRRGRAGDPESQRHFTKNKNTGKPCIYKNFRCFGCLLKNGSNGARTHDLSRVRRTLIPAELYFHFLEIARLELVTYALRTHRSPS